MQHHTTIGIDLAKDVLAVCVLDATGAVVMSKVLKRDAFVAWAEQLPPCTVVMEACGSAHYWGRWFASRGHMARLIAAEFVQPFRKSSAAKNDRNDAEAIAIASRQPTMRYVAIKSVEQQSILAWHRMREGWKEERTALLNRLRGLLGEFGLWPSRSADKLIRALPDLSEDARLPDGMRAIVMEMQQQLSALHERLARCDHAIAQHVKAHPERASRLQRWIVELYGRVGYHKTLVAIANKHARMLWAMLAKGETYDPNAWDRAMA